MRDSIAIIVEVHMHSLTSLVGVDIFIYIHVITRAQPPCLFEARMKADARYRSQYLFAANASACQLREPILHRRGRDRQWYVRALIIHLRCHRMRRRRTRTCDFWRRFNIAHARGNVRLGAHVCTGNVNADGRVLSWNEHFTRHRHAA